MGLLTIVATAFLLCFPAHLHAPAAAPVMDNPTPAMDNPAPAPVTDNQGLVMDTSTPVMDNAALVAHNHTPVKDKSAPASYHSAPVTGSHAQTMSPAATGTVIHTSTMRTAIPTSHTTNSPVHDTHVITSSDKETPATVAKVTVSSLGNHASQGAPDEVKNMATTIQDTFISNSTEQAFALSSTREMSNLDIISPTQNSDHTTTIRKTAKAAAVTATSLHTSSQVIPRSSNHSSTSVNGQGQADGLALAPLLESMDNTSRGTPAPGLRQQTSAAPPSVLPDTASITPATTTSPTVAVTTPISLLSSPSKQVPTHKGTVHSVTVNENDQESEIATVTVTVAGLESDKSITNTSGKYTESQNETHSTTEEDIADIHVHSNESDAVESQMDSHNSESNLIPNHTAAFQQPHNHIKSIPSKGTDYSSEHKPETLLEMVARIQRQRNKQNTPGELVRTSKIEIELQKLSNSYQNITIFYKPGSENGGTNGAGGKRLPELQISHKTNPSSPANVQHYYLRQQWEGSYTDWEDWADSEAIFPLHNLSAQRRHHLVAATVIGMLLVGGLGAVLVAILWRRGHLHSNRPPRNAMRLESIPTVQVA